MAVPSSGPISMQDLADEFNGSQPISISQYYRNGGLVSSNNTNVPESGEISLSDFYGATGVIAFTMGDSGSRVLASTLFGSNWAADVPKVLTIPSGVTVGSSDTTQEALQIDTGMGGTLTVSVSGNIQGAGGADNGGDGGNALVVNQTYGVTVNVNTGGSIYAGGGGGGHGGAGGGGGGGQYTTTSEVRNPGGGAVVPYCLVEQITCVDYCVRRYGAGTYSCHRCMGPQSCTDDGPESEVWCTECYLQVSTTNNTSGGSGGTGGVGGRGQGYGQAFNSGTAGGSGSGGGSNAGTGGSGGEGGDGGGWGTAGATGNSGTAGSNGNRTGGSSGSSGSDGGTAGFSILNIANITLNNSGSMAGQT